MTSERLLAGRERSDWLLWPPHEAHARTQRWSPRRDQGWATCAMTRPLVRIVSNPAFSRAWFLHEMRWKFLARQSQHRATGFGLTILGSQKRCSVRRADSWSQQVTDGYLLALAIHRREGCDSGFRGLRLCWRIRVTKETFGAGVNGGRTAMFIVHIIPVIGRCELMPMRHCRSEYIHGPRGDLNSSPTCTAVFPPKVRICATVADGFLKTSRYAASVHKMSSTGRASA